MTRLFVRSPIVLSALVVGSWIVHGCDFNTDSIRQLEGGDSTYVNSLGMRFQRLPAGTFKMGSTNGQDDEEPVHEVQITKPFYMGVHEVTQAQWDILMEHNPSHFQGPYRPVDSVSWHSAQLFIRRLNEKEDTEVYRLPTEAEWEYAVRAGSKTRFHFGDARDSLAAHAWYSFNSDRRTHDVGRKRRNPFGLYDVYGNVWEWVRDVYDTQFYERSPRTDPLNRGSQLVPRVIRGGGWFAVVSDLRSANRGWARPGARDPQLGFRIVREISQE